MHLELRYTYKTHVSVSDVECTEKHAHHTYGIVRSPSPPGCCSPPSFQARAIPANASFRFPGQAGRRSR